MKLIKILLSTIVFAPSIAFACMFDADCDLGSRCIKERGENYGVCADRIPSSNACTFDADCDLGGKCKKERGETNGICAGGIPPGKKDDKQPVYAPPDLLDPDSTFGKKCSFDIDCGSGSRCLKDRDAIDGVCVGAR